MSIFAEKKTGSVAVTHRSVILASALCGFAAPALAHSGGHAHPHAAGGWEFALAFAALGAFVLRALRRPQGESP